MIPEVKICKLCLTEKSRSEFSEQKKTSRSGDKIYILIDPYCKECKRIIAKENYYKNIPRARAAKAANYAKNRDRDCAYAKAYRASHKERNSELDKAYKLANRAKLTAAQNARYMLNKRATPPWLSFIHRALIMEFYELANARSMQTGMKHHVDHIFPLSGRSFCGINVPWNLRIIDASTNMKKYNNVPKEYSDLLWSAA